MITKRKQTKSKVGTRKHTMSGQHVFEMGGGGQKCTKYNKTIIIAIKSF